MTKLRSIGGAESLSAGGGLDNLWRDGLSILSALPCVVYEADERFRVTSVAPSVKELLGIDARNMSAFNWLCNDRVAFPDRELLRTELAKLTSHSAVWLIHRLTTDNGSLINVAHSVRSRAEGSRRYFQGCLTPVPSKGSERAIIEIETVSKFIHKIGNHFQLLNLMFDSIRRSGATAKNLDALQQTTETAIGLTRGFANLLQSSSVTNTIHFAELLESTIDSRSHVGIEKEISIEFRKGAAIQDMRVCGDAVLLEMAIGAVIENAIEASPRGAAVRIELCSRSETMARFGLNMAAVRVIDSGPGIHQDQLAQVSQPFYTTRPGHEGMGLSIATRYVEMHSGFIYLTSIEREGTEVGILLPLAKSSGESQQDAELE